MKGKILVMGVGWVGGTVARWLDSKGLEPLKYDPPKGLGSDDDLAKAEIIIICLPTPYDEAKGGFDLSYVEAGVAKLPGKKTVVIKSTVLPGTTDQLRARFPQHTFLFNPEFLRQSSADSDFASPDRQIVGAHPEDNTTAQAFLDIFPDAPFKKIVSPTEAETVKYFGNCFLAMKVVFANQLFDLCAALGVDYDAVKDCAGQDPRIGTGHLQVVHDGYRGYGGSCFPKDMRALIQLGDRVGVEMRLLKEAERLNNGIIAQNPSK